MTTRTLAELIQQGNALRPTLPIIFPWPRLREIIDRSELASLHRHPILENIYFNEFLPQVRQEYGSVDAYLKLQLAWGPEEERSKTEEYWTRTDEVRVRLNDWCYSIPMDVKHWVCWTRLPLVHPALCSSAGWLHNYSEVQQRGLSGFTGAPGPPAPQLEGFGKGPEGPAREVEAFVKDRWPEDLWETAL